MPPGQGSVRLGNVAGQREQQRHCVLGGGDHVRLRRVGDDDPGLCGGVDVDVVDPHPGPAHRSQPPSARDQRGIELRRRPDQNAVVRADTLLELLATRRRRDRRRSAPRRLDSGVADLLRHQHARTAPVRLRRDRGRLGGGHRMRSSTQSMQAGQRLHVARIRSPGTSRPALGCARACGMARRRRSRWRAAWTPDRPRPPRGRVDRANDQRALGGVADERGRVRDARRPTRTDGWMTPSCGRTIASRPPRSSIHSS